MSDNVTITTSDFPVGYCPTSLAEFWPVAVSLLHANLSGINTTINFGNTTPAPEDRNKPWYRTESSGRPDRWYVYSDGSWLSRHPSPPGVIIFYEGADGTIDTFDGGESSTIPVTETTGPMWKKVPDLAARFPVGAGTLPSGTALAVGATGGEEKNTLAIENVPFHRHFFDIGAQGAFLISQNIPTLDTKFANQVTKQTTGAGGDASTGVTVPHNTMPPFAVGNFLVRTARLYYRI